MHMHVPSRAKRSTPQVEAEIKSLNSCSALTLSAEELSNAASGPFKLISSLSSVVGLNECYSKRRSEKEIGLESSRRKKRKVEKEQINLICSNIVGEVLSVSPMIFSLLSHVPEKITIQ